MTSEGTGNDTTPPCIKDASRKGSDGPVVECNKEISECSSRTSSATSLMQPSNPEAEVSEQQQQA